MQVAEKFLNGTWIIKLAEASKSWEESEPSFIDLNLLLDCEKISDQNASLQELCDILQSNGFEVEAMPDSDSFGAYVPCPEESDGNSSDQESYCRFTYLSRLLFILTFCRYTHVWNKI